MVPLALDTVRLCRESERASREGIGLRSGVWFGVFDTLDQSNVSSSHASKLEAFGADAEIEGDIGAE